LTTPEFEWDAQKAAENLRNHGVTFDEAVTVFADPLASIFDDRRCYAELDLAASDVNAFYENQGFAVERIPWEDPHHSKADSETKRRNLERCRAQAVGAFDSLLKPVLLQCSSGIDRSAPVAAYVWQQRSAV
jgi:hypothetical protein